jgi:hypothetical protein
MLDEEKSSNIVAPCAMMETLEQFFELVRCHEIMSCNLILFFL